MSVTNTILRKVQDNIEKYNMFSNGDTVVVGVSGGADSVMLLHCLNTLKDKYNLHLIVAHINHKIRKGDAERDADFVKDLCNKLGVEYHLKEEDVKRLAKEKGMSEEEAGRLVRYGFFRELCSKDGECVGKIATAHNANDNVETVFMRFMRGTGIKGLSGIPFKNNNIVRPILNITRDEIEGYIQENGLTHITDKTNFESIYTRNKIRLELLPFIKKMFNPNIIGTMTENIQSFKEDSEFIDGLASEKFKKICVVEGQCVKCDLEALKSENVAISKRIIMMAIQQIKGKEQINLSSKTINDIVNGLDSKVGTLFTLSEDFEILLDYKYLIVREKEVQDDNFEYQITTEMYEEGSEEYPKFNLKLSFSRGYETNIDNNGEVIYLPFEFVRGKTLTLRTVKNGDVFRVCDNCHKKLKRVFTDKRVSKIERDKMILLCDENEVLWCINGFATRFENRDGDFLRVKVEDFC